MVGSEPVGPWDLHVPIIIQSPPQTRKEKEKGWFVAGFERGILGLAFQPLTHNAELGP